MVVAGLGSRFASPAMDVIKTSSVKRTAGITDSGVESMSVHVEMRDPNVGRVGVAGIHVGMDNAGPGVGFAGTIGKPTPTAPCIHWLWTTALPTALWSLIRIPFRNYKC